MALTLQGGSGGFLQGGGTTQVTSPSTNAQMTVSGNRLNTTPIGPSSGAVLGANTVKAAPVDPYSGTVFGSTAGYNKAVADYNSSRDSAFNSINDATSNAASGYNSSILDYLDARKAQQGNIDASRVQNELARQQGTQGILNMVSNGIRSGGVQLANANSGSSSAAEALARAYGTVGRQQQSSVNNQAAQGEAKIDADQNNLFAADATQARHTEESKTNTINTIVNSARQQLASLNQSAAYASLPDRINIESKVAQIKQQALNALSAFDQTLRGGIAGQGPKGADAVRADATRLLNAGTAPDTSFNYTTEVPAQFQNTGQFASELPIFTSPNRRQNQ